jgi:hypothetical protein
VVAFLILGRLVIHCLDKEANMKIFSVIQYNEWACPGMLVATDDDGYIIWTQQNPNNELTKTWFDEEEFKYKFDPSEYKSVIQVL